MTTTGFRKSSTDTVRIGVVGASFAGSFHADIWQETVGAEVIAVAEMDHARRDSFVSKYGVSSAYEDYRSLLEDSDVDLVDICLPNFLHAEVSVAALEAGKHVICEKPLATRLDDAEQVVNTAARVAGHYFYAEDWLFAPALVRAKSIIEEGAIGEVLYCRGKETHNGSHSPFAQTIEYCGGGAFIHLAVHPIGLFQSLYGPPESIVGRCSGGLEANMIHTGMEGEDWGVGVLSFSGGRQAVVEGNYITTGGMDDVVEFYGTDGVLKTDLTFGSPLSVYSRKGYGYAVEKADFTYGWTRPAVDEYYSLGYRDELQHFADCVREGREQAAGTSAEDGLEVLRTINAVYDSSRKGTVIHPAR